MTSPNRTLLVAYRRASAIQLANIDIYQNLIPDRTDLIFADEELQALLVARLTGSTLTGPLRSRSKLARQLVAMAMGYKPPTSFRRMQPRFPGQNLDVYVQMSDNLQIWNQDVSPNQRYVLIRPDDQGIIRAIRIIKGHQIIQWDRTGTLTSKFQAKRKTGRTGSALVSLQDTKNFISILQPVEVPIDILASQSSDQSPKLKKVIPIAGLYHKLLNKLIGLSLPAVSIEKDRVRGELLQTVVCQELGLRRHENHGQWPDIVSQALEVKLQTSPTIDLGLILPTNESPAPALGSGLRHCDARYLIAYGEPKDQSTIINEIVITTGLDFLLEFTQFGELVQNKKRQIKLPRGLFQAKS